MEGDRNIPVETAKETFFAGLRVVGGAGKKMEPGLRAYFKELTRRDIVDPAVTAASRYGRSMRKVFSRRRIA